MEEIKEILENIDSDCNQTLVKLYSLCYYALSWGSKKHQEMLIDVVKSYKCCRGKIRNYEEENEKLFEENLRLKKELENERNGKGEDF